MWRDPVGGGRDGWVFFFTYGAEHSLYIICRKAKTRIRKLRSRKNGGEGCF